jgi:hypothetical protein
VRDGYACASAGEATVRAIFVREAPAFFTGNRAKRLDAEK